MNRKMIFLICLFLSVPSAEASSIFYYVKPGPGIDVGVKLKDKDIGTFAGQLMMSWNKDKSDYFPVHCLSVDHWLLLDGQEVEVRWLSELPDQSPLNPPNARNSGPLLAGLLEKHAGAVKDNVSAAALGLALWEILYDWDTGSSLSLFAGNFQLKGAHSDYESSMAGMAVDMAHGYLLSINGNQGKAIWFDAVGYDGYDSAGNRIRLGQDLATAMSVYNGPVPVPEPSSLLLLGPAILGLGWRMMRRRMPGCPDASQSSFPS